MILVLLTSLIAAPGDWPTLLSYSFEPHERRVPAEITAPADADLLGVPVDLPVGDGDGRLPLVGARIESIRVTDDDGMELLWTVLGDGEVPLTEGSLEPGHRLVVPGTCQAGETARVWVYWGSDEAWAPPEYLPTGLSNSDFEQPGLAGWVEQESGPGYAMDLAPGEGRGGSVAARCTVDAGSPPRWVKYAQTEIPVRPGATYRLEGWVRPDGADGQVGLFVHVFNDGEMALNHLESVDPTSDEWQPVAWEFAAPAGADHATVGTVLYGTGTCYYDDIRLAAEQALAGRVAIGETEELALETHGDGHDAVAWNTTADARGPVLVEVDLREPILRQARCTGDFDGIERRMEEGYTARLGAGPAVDGFGSGTVRFFPLQLPARSRVLLDLDPAGDPAAPPSAITSTDANLCRGGPLDSPADLEAWGGARSERGHTVDLDDGQLVVRVPEARADEWLGAIQAGIAVRQGARYLYGAMVKTGELGGTVDLHAHLKDAQGEVLEFVSTSRSVGPNEDWQWVGASFAAPAAAETIDLHLTTNTWGEIRYDDVVLAEVVRAQPVAPDPPAAPPGLQASYVDPLVKVFPSDAFEPGAYDGELWVARGEAESAQIVVHGGSPCSVQVDPPVSGEGDELLDVSIDRVGYVKVDYPSGYYRADVPAHARRIPTGPPRADGWAGLWPDPLVPVGDGEEIDATEGAQPIWLTVRVPGNAAPGRYEGRVRLATDAETLELPLIVHVRSFELPESAELTAILDLRQGPGGPAHLPPPVDASREAWHRFMADHRVCVDIVPAPVFALEDGRVTMDATEFDRWAALCLDELGMNSLYTPWIFYGFGWAYPVRPFLGTEPFTPQWHETITEAYGLFLDHLEERGWRDRIIHYVSDEPHTYTEGVVDRLSRFCQVFEEIAPDVPRYSSTWWHHEGLNEAISLWGAGHYGVFPVETMDERVEAGDEILFTTDGQMCIDTPWCAVERLLPYYAFRYGTRGYEFWGVSWWTFDPYEWATHRFIRQSNEGEDFYYVRYPNGDGYLAYPGQRYGVTGPLSSIRMEQVREGLEDAECLFLLRDLLAAADPDSPAAQAGRQALAAAEALVPIPNAGGLRSSEVLPDPTRVREVRRRIGDAIEGLVGAG